jgi:hypothetical protein
MRGEAFRLVLEDALSSAKGRHGVGGSPERDTTGRPDAMAPKQDGRGLSPATVTESDAGQHRRGEQRCDGWPAGPASWAGLAARKREGKSLEASWFGLSAGILKTHCVAHRIDQPSPNFGRSAKQPRR